LQWCFEVAQQTTIPARVTEILSSGTNSWEIRYQNSGTTASLKVDGVVLTGAGKAREIPLLGSPPGGRILNAETFWPHRADVCDLREGTIAVAGDGGAAGAIIAWLVEVMEERSVAIQSISPMGTMLPRGDGYSERRRFSDPSDWSELTHEHRNAILRRTDAGVISLKNKAVIDQAKSVIYTSGKVMSAEWTGDDVRLNIEYDKKRQPDVPCDYFINAIGFDQWTLLDLVKHSKIASILERTSGADLRKQIEANMLPDLSLPPIAGVGSGLHVPSLAAFQHGPGMGNLGSLGLMATAILNSYLD
jgi:mycobactin lysine-N-oxygenase